MEELAQVTHLLDGNMAEVELRRHSACDKCGKCSKGTPTRVEVMNPVRAQVGDMVVLEMETSHILTSVLIIYLLPIVNLLIGYGLAAWVGSALQIWSGEIVPMLIGLVFMALTFVFVRVYDRKKGRDSSFKPRIKRVTYNY